ncbi:hypothetical protein ANRL3_00207 [Anaerolineae bacterium]|nr:hypothetical protein ANRL3_00207 [Anaerolineae bacterium]
MTHAIKDHYWTMYNKLHDSVWGVTAAFLVVFMAGFFLTTTPMTIVFAVYLAFILPLPSLRWPLLTSLLGIAFGITALVTKMPLVVALESVSIIASFGCFVARWDLFRVSVVIGTIAIVAYYIFSGILIKAVGVLVLVACYGAYFVVSRTVFTVNLNSGGQSRRRYSRRKKPSTASTA